MKLMKKTNRKSGKKKNKSYKFADGTFNAPI